MNDHVNMCIGKITKQLYETVSHQDMDCHQDVKVPI